MYEEACGSTMRQTAGRAVGDIPRTVTEMQDLREAPTIHDILKSNQKDWTSKGSDWVEDPTDPVWKLPTCLQTMLRCT